MWNWLLDYHGNRVQHTTLTYEPRTTDFRSRIRPRLSWVGRNWVATGGHHFRGIVWRILGTTRRSNHTLYPSGHFVRPVHHGHFDHLLFVTLSTFTGGPSTLMTQTRAIWREENQYIYLGDAGMTREYKDTENRLKSLARTLVYGRYWRGRR